jgi:hypothetical protein
MWRGQWSDNFLRLPKILRGTEFGEIDVTRPKKRGTPQRAS